LLKLPFYQIKIKSLHRLKRALNIFFKFKLIISTKLTKGIEND